MEDLLNTFNKLRIGNSKEKIIAQYISQVVKIIDLCTKKKMYKFYNVEDFSRDIKNNPSESIEQFFFQYIADKIKFDKRDCAILGIDPTSYSSQDINLLWNMMEELKVLSIKYQDNTLNAGGLFSCDPPN